MTKKPRFPRNVFSHLSWFMFRDFHEFDRSYISHSSYPFHRFEFTKAKNIRCGSDTFSLMSRVTTSRVSSGFDSRPYSESSTEPPSSNIPEKVSDRFRDSNPFVFSPLSRNWSILTSWTRTRLTTSTRTTKRFVKMSDLSYWSKDNKGKKENKGRFWKGQNVSWKVEMSKGQKWIKVSVGNLNVK